MHLLLGQLDLIWEDPERNFSGLAARLHAQPPVRGSMLVLPEMFPVGFSMNISKTSEELGGLSERRLVELARTYGIWIVSGLVTRSGEVSTLQSGALAPAHNEAITIDPSGGVVSRYRKMHPFSFAGENRFFLAGDDVAVIDCGSIRVSPLICYDLRFPEVFRRATLRGAGLLIVIANWPAKRESHWLNLLTARAIENQAYVVGVNRTGADPDHRYSGHSRVIDPKGELVFDAGSDEGLFPVTIDPDAVRDWRAQFPALSDVRPELLGQI